MTDYIHKEFPKTCAPDDFFGQVKRTVDGKPVPQEQIDLIVGTIRNALGLSKLDVLLDLGCGNGALSRYLFDDCIAYLGVDFSEYLVEIAKANFEDPPSHVFRLGDAVAYASSEPQPQRFTKGLCYGVFSYFSPTQAEKLLQTLAERFTGLQRVFIGNLPDRDRADRFFRNNEDVENLLDERDSPLGIWRSKAFMKELAHKTGWHARISEMPERFYAAHYRFDVLLTRQGTAP